MRQKATLETELRFTSNSSLSAKKRCHRYSEQPEEEPISPDLRELPVVTHSGKVWCLSQADSAQLKAPSLH